MSALLELTKPTLVIFDCDGVLVDSEPLANLEFVRALNAIDVPMTLQECMQRFVGRSMKSCYAEIEAQLGRPMPNDFAGRLDAATYAAFERELQAVEGIESVLDALDAKGVRYCVASSGSHEKMRVSLGKTGLWERFGPPGFERIYSSTQVRNGKPAPDLFEFAAAQCAADAADCLVVEDSVPGVQAGVAANMQVAGHAAAIAGDQSMGAIGDSAARLRQAGAVPFASMAELRSWILRF